MKCMKSHRLVYLACTTLLLPAVGSHAASGPQDPPPNVLFLAVDDLKDWVNCLGGYEGTVHTPHIDRLAQQGILFTNAHCPSPKCAPSRAAIMTGLRPSTTGLYDNGHWWLPNLPDAVTIPRHFSQHGYRVVGAGKIFHHTAGNNPPGQWDDFLRLTFRNDPWFRGAKRNYPWSQSAPFPREFPYSGVHGLGHENDWGSLGIPESRYDDALSADYAIRFLREHHEQPFFLACGLFRPHLPWYVPRRYFDLYPVDQIVLPAVLDQDLNDVPAAGRDFARSRRSDLEAIRAAGGWKSAVQAYLASISFADAQLGRVLQTLNQSPHQKNTLVVLWSDHGWHLGEKNHWHKTTLWEEATRIPLIISLPERRAAVCSRPVSLLDLYPTLIDLCHLPLVKTLDGTSLKPLLDNPDRQWKKPAIIEFQPGNCAVRTERYRYIQYQDGSEELYDHRHDPQEWHNLADSRQHTAIRQQLAGSVTQQWSAPALTKNAFRFDPESFTWTHKVTGRITHGNRKSQ